MHSVQSSIKCTVHYTVYSPVYSAQYIIQCTVCSVHYIIQFTVYRTVYSVEYYRTDTAFSAMAARMHTFEPRSFRLRHMMFGYKNFIPQTHCVPAISLQYGVFTLSLPLGLLLSHNPHRWRLKSGKWEPLDLLYNDCM